MFGDPFYHQTIRTLTVAFGTLFNNISVRRLDKTTGAVIKTIKVPLSYAARDKYIARLYERSSIKTDQTKINIQLPRMSFEMGSPRHDNTRQLSKMTRLMNEVDNVASYQFQRVPYNFSFNLSAWVKNIDDGFQIIEQICPFFAPHYVLTVVDNPDLDESSNIPILLDSVTMTDTYEGDFSAPRITTVDFAFTMKAWMYKPTSESGLIKKVIVQLYSEVDPSSAPLASRITVTPDPADANLVDTWDYDTNIETFEFDEESSSSSSSSDSSSSSNSSSSSSESS